MTDDRMPCYDELINTIFDREEREKFEWMVGSIICGPYRKRRKSVLVISGECKTGKSTVLNIVCNLFPMRWFVFVPRTVARKVTLRPHVVEIQHDMDLHKLKLADIPLVPLFVATNGNYFGCDVINHLVDAKTSGRILPKDRYDHLIYGLEREYMDIMWHCVDVFKADTGKYNNYIPR